MSGDETSLADYRARVAQVRATVQAREQVRAGREGLMQLPTLPVAARPCCGGVTPPRWRGEFFRDLLYHVCPLATSESARAVWRSNVCQLKKRLWQFDGLRLVAIATGDGLESPAEVQRQFAGERVDVWLILENHPIREVFSFLPLMSQLPNGENRIAFYAHTKGVTHPPTASVHRWATLAYETCLDYPGLVDAALHTQTFVGSFKKLGRGFSAHPPFRFAASEWHYSGTFFWFRTSRVFAGHWTDLELHPYALEAWPSGQCESSAAGCLFYEASVPEMNLYSRAVLDLVVEPRYAAWCEQHRASQVTSVVEKCRCK